METQSEEVTQKPEGFNEALESALAACMLHDPPSFVVGFSAGVAWAMRDMPSTEDGVKVVPNQDPIWINPGTGGWMGDSSTFNRSFDNPIVAEIWSYYDDHIWFQPKGDDDGYHWDGPFYSSGDAALAGNPIDLRDDELYECIAEFLCDNPVTLDEGIDRTLDRPVTDDERQTIHENLNCMKRCGHCNGWFDTDNCSPRENLRLKAYDCCEKCYDAKLHLRT